MAVIRNSVLVLKLCVRPGIVLFPLDMPSLAFLVMWVFWGRALFVKKCVSEKKIYYNFQLHFCWLLYVGGVLFEYFKGVIYSFHKTLQFLIKATIILIVFTFTQHFFLSGSFRDLLIAASSQVGDSGLLVYSAWFYWVSCIYECGVLDGLKKPVGINNSFSFLVLTSPCQFWRVQFYMLCWLNLFNCHRDFHFY